MSLHWKCTECSWRGPETELLKAPNPFEPTEQVFGCPSCKCVDQLVPACDEPGCSRAATCGWQSSKGYRRTCYDHQR